MKKIIINTEIYNKVPLNEYYQEDKAYKGLVFIQHGYQSNKSYGANYLALDLARLGFFVVSIDAYKHGERIEEPFTSKIEKAMLVEAPNVIRHTAIDYIKLHKMRYIDRFPKYDFIGISMGAMIAFYLSTKTDKVRKLVPVIGTPDYLYQARYQLKASGLNEDDFLTPEVIEYLSRISPINHADKIRFDEMFLLNCDQDKVVPMCQSVDYYNEYKTDKMKLNIYQDGHEVNRKMQLDIFNFINK